MSTMSKDWSLERASMIVSVQHRDQNQGKHHVCENTNAAAQQNIDQMRGWQKYVSVMVTVLQGLGIG